MGEEASPEVSPPRIEKPAETNEAGKRAVAGVPPPDSPMQLSPTPPALPPSHPLDGFLSPQLPLPVRRYQQLIVNTVNFTIPYGYSVNEEDVRYLGGGAYGNVVRTKAECKDGVVREVAIKKLKEPFLDPIQCRRIYREIRLLQLMKHDNIIKAIDIYTPDNIEHKFKDVYVVTEYAGVSLYKVLREQSERDERIIQAEHVKFIVYQLLRALKYIHSANIIHRDLKPGNLALTKDSDLTVLDFGLARSLEPRSPTLTQYVMTRWYRSPEVIYWSIQDYDIQADIWSVGCIAAELMTGRPLFPGEDANSQYDMITKMCGSPDEELMQKIEDTNSSAMRTVIESYPHYERRNFKDYFAHSTNNEDFIDFLDKILVLDPKRRMTVGEALAHKYMAEYFMPEDEPVASRPFNLDEPVEHTLAQWKGIIWNEIHSFRGDNKSPKIQ